MIRCIAALDDKRGIARDGVVPWHGMVPSDMQWFRRTTLGHSILMGSKTFKTLPNALPERTNYVATRQGKVVTDAEPIVDAADFISKFPADDDLWIIGGGDIFAQTIGRAEELYLTRVSGDFQCTTFFPAFASDFRRTFSSEPITEGDINFHFEVWHRK